MPVHIGELTSDVTLIQGDLPLSAEQLDRLVRLVLECLESKQREERMAREATAVRRAAAPPLGVEQGNDR